jgi:hypothetical protein
MAARQVGQPLADELIDQFKALFDEPPPWAWPFKPSIPFVGKQYKPGRGLLIYASAENLTGLNGHVLPVFFRSPAVWNRYRVQYQAEDRDKGGFFPYVGIQPANDGGLLAAGLFIAEHYQLPRAATPRAFLERTAISNWCKFTIQSGTNRDYIGNVDKLIVSLPYVVNELATLRPRVVLLPKRLWDQPSLRAAMRGASPRTLFLPAPQFNARVINTRLASFDRRTNRLRARLRASQLGSWMARLRAMNTKNAWRYIAALGNSIAEAAST